MEFEIAVNWTQKMIWTAAMCAAPALLAALVAGLLISIFQAVTQIHEMTLTFVPKIVAVALAFVVCAGWMLKVLVRFAIEMFVQLPAAGP